MKTVIKFFIAFLLLFYAYTPAFAYIDPGFGSMMLSLILALVTTIYFLLYSFVIFLKRFLFKKTDLSKTKNPFVIYSDGSEYFSVFKPIADEFEKRRIPLLFYTSSKDDPFFECDYKFVKGKYIGKNNEAYINLAFLKADICLMTTPQLDVLQLKRSKFVKYYLHIFHGITTSMDYRLFSLDYYDGVLCDGEFQIPLIRELEEKRNLKNKDLVVVGSTYMDFLEEKLKTIPKRESENFTVLIAPSWGENSIFNKYSNIIDKLIKTNWDIIIRPHPRSYTVEKDMILEFQKKYENNKNVIWDKNLDNIYSMANSDILITDYSTVMFDYAFLFDKPFLYTTFDMNRDILDISDIEGPIWRYEVMKKIGFEINNKNINEIVSLIENIKDNKEIKLKLKEEIQKAKDIAWFYRGESAKRAVDFILEKYEEIKSC